MIIALIFIKWNISLLFFCSQSISNDKKHENESEQTVLHEPVVATRKTTPSTDVRLNRKSMFEQPTNQSNSHVLERVNILFCLCLVSRRNY